jgi:hypothetical protein
VRDANQGLVLSSSLPSQQLFPQEDLVAEGGELNFIPFEHTTFSSDNIRAMSLLIMLFER